MSEINQRRVSNRIYRTNRLTKRALAYCTNRKWAAAQEVAVSQWNSMRIDVVAWPYDADSIIGIEVKSSAADWRCDDKWPAYLKYVDQFYFLADQITIDNTDMMDQAKEHGVGILVPGTGYQYCVVKRRAKKLEPSRKEWRDFVIRKIAYRRAIGDGYEICRRLLKEEREAKMAAKA